MYVNIDFACHVYYIMIALGVFIVFIIKNTVSKKDNSDHSHSRKKLLSRNFKRFQFQHQGLPTKATSIEEAKEKVKNYLVGQYTYVDGAFPSKSSETVYVRFNRVSKISKHNDKIERILTQTFNIQNTSDDPDPPSWIIDVQEFNT